MNYRRIDELPTLAEIQQFGDFPIAAADISGKADSLNYKLELGSQEV